MRLHISPFVRNLGIVAVAAALVTAGGELTSRALSIAFAIVNVAFLIGLGWFALTVYRENRGTFSLMAPHLRLALYGSAIGLVIVVLTAPLWVTSFATAVLFFALIAIFGYIIYRVWGESRRYYY